MAESSFQSGHALIVVDVQRDFCAGGALPIPGGDDVVPVLNEWINAACESGAHIVFSRDWHPPDHVSFRRQGGPWPKHCVQGSPGAEFHPQLKVPEGAQLVSKGTEPAVDNYSAFDGTGLAAELRSRGVQSLWIGGLAQEICVRATVLDACRAGFEVHLIARGTRPVDQEQGRMAIQEMLAAGAVIEQKGPYELSPV